MLFQNLPITPFLSEIAQQLTEQGRLILQAEPGAGKSTAVPWYLLKHLELADKKIVMLEPRRLAATSLAHYLAKLLGEQVGETVGYQIKNERCISSQTRLEIVTEGVLTARILNDPELHDVGLIIFDEFHERSLHADLGLALGKEIVQAYNETLKVLVMSATIDSQRVSDFLQQAPIINCPGRCFPVAETYLAKPIDSLHFRDWQNPMIKLITQAYQASDGDVLVFLPGQAEIHKISQQLAGLINQNLQVLVPLYGQLKAQQQQQALQIDALHRQKIILATNIAETSLTLPNISAVVDCGLVKESVYDVSSGMNRLLTRRIAKASAEQRKGRAGRLQAGAVYRLWTESQQTALAEFSPLPIMQSDLTNLRLSLAQWGVTERTEIDWITPPPVAHYEAANDLLISLELLNEKGQLTEIGAAATGFNVEPRLARLLIMAKTLAKELTALACDLVAVLSESHFYHASQDADILSRLQALQLYRDAKQQALKQFPIKPAVIQQVAASAKRLRQKLGLTTDIHAYPYQAEQVGQLLSWAFPDRIAKRRSSQSAEQVSYIMSNGKTAILKQPNHLMASDWLVIADLDGQRKDGLIYLASAVILTDLQDYPGFAETPEYVYNAAKNRLEGHQITRLGAIVLQQQTLLKPNKQAMQACLFHTIKQTNLEVLPWTPSIAQWLNKVRWLMSVAPKETQDWPDFSQKGLVDSLEKWLFPYIEAIDSIQELNTVELLGLIKNRLDYASLQQLEQQAPDVYQPPNGKAMAIDYAIGQLPKVSLPLQALFGELSSPSLAWGKVTLSFELLSPARRPLQTTSDLAGFWQSSYVDIAKEMRGRYPKHRWPEEPLLEQPGKSLKKRS